jgi:signal transduction histidine kinase
MNDSFRSVQLRITTWYVGIFAGILLLFGTAVYLALTHQIGRARDADLVAAADQIERALSIREEERGLTDHTVDALRELRIPGDDLYVFDEAGRALGSDVPPPFLTPFVAEALARDTVWGRPETAPDASWRVYGRRLRVGAQTYAAFAVTAAVEVEDRYPGLLTSFFVAALCCLMLVALGGAALARKSLVPVEQSVERMRRFVADASHELRTPASVLRTRAEVALGRARTVEEYAGIMEKMRDEAAHLGYLVDELLLLAAVDAHRLVLHKQPVFLDDLLVQASETARPLASSKEIHLELDRFDEAPVEADPDLVRQLLFILLENAVKYTPAGGRVCAGVAAEGGRCMVTVQDTGPGISPEVLPHVFERFYRADPARPKEGGSGLGLAIAKSIADAHGAEITLASTVGEGTTARVSFPRRPDSVRTTGPLPVR